MMQLPWDLNFSPVGLPAGLTIDLQYDAGRSILFAAISNSTANSLEVGQVRIESPLDRQAAGGSLWLHGRYMQEDALIHRLGQPPDASYSGRLVRKGMGAHRFISHEVIALALTAPTVPAIVAGSLSPADCFLDFEVTAQRDESRLVAIALLFDLRGIHLRPGERRQLPPILVIAGGDPYALLEQYASVAGRELDARVPSRIPTGWCSWYYFYNRVTEGDVLANVDEMARSGYPAEYIEVDDGYQSRTGDWLTPNRKFPSGMEVIASRIRSAGYRPGLWLAPLVLHEKSAALSQQPEMALRTRAGKTLFVSTWLGRCAVLDCTHPQSEAWLRHLINTVVSEWGYEYLKLDALAFAAQSPHLVRYHLEGTTAPQNLRRGLEIIREVARDQTFLLGCTCHFGPAIGVVDAMRVGPDVKATWFHGRDPSVKHAMRMTLQRNWMHKRWWANDPDCLIVRDTDTHLKSAEIRFLATGIAVSGGMVFGSDNLPQLSDERRNLALALYPPAGIPARPVDPLDAPVPSLWRAELGDGRSLVGALNWTDSPLWIPRDAVLEPGEVAFDVWEGVQLGMGDRLLEPHEGVLLQVTSPGATPRVIGDSGHISFDGLYERRVSGRLQVRNDLPRTRTIAVEARGRVLEVQLAPNEMRWFD